MTKAPASPVFGLVDRLRSAIRTGRRLRLEPEQARILMSEEIYLAISRLEAREVRRLADADAGLGSKSAITGFGNDPRSSPGTSAGSSKTPADVVSRGASRLLREEAALALRRKKLSMRSRPTT
jgi:hypothetical protein